MKNYIKKIKYITSVIALMSTLLLQAQEITGTWTGELEVQHIT